MPFSIPELLSLFLYLAIIFLATRIYYKNWSTSTKIVVAAAVLIILGENIEAFVGEVASTIYFALLLVGAIFLYIKKPR